MIRAASKTTIYDNCQLLDPDGTLIGRISQKKMKWYLDLGLGEQMYACYPPLPFRVPLHELLLCALLDAPSSLMSFSQH